jgi:hypothetical protein
MMNLQGSLLRRTTRSWRQGLRGQSWRPGGVGYVASARVALGVGFWFGVRHVDGVDGV